MVVKTALTGGSTACSSVIRLTVNDVGDERHREATSAVVTLMRGNPHSCDGLLNAASAPRRKPAAARETVRRAEAGEPGRNRTVNPQIKSLLLCQLSYRPTSVFLVARGKWILPQG